MIDNVLNLLKENLNNYIRIKTEVAESMIVYPDGSRVQETRNFEPNRVTMQLINLAEENSVRPAEMYMETSPNGKKYSVNPEIRLNLFILFVARFNNYEQSMRYLSLVIRYFQNHRVFDHQNSPTLGPDQAKIWVELVTMPFTQQNEIWNAMRSPYLPSFLYKVKMLVFRDEEALKISQETTSVQVEINKSL
ncbi:MAG: DUF4255 domain-containing protein [Bacteroidia bacterium]|nr:DUF4255 domain-containing protein [Bacteroidia bacterium]